MGKYRRDKMNKALICFIIAAVFLLPTVNCITVSVKTNVGEFTEHLGSGIDGTINGNTVITRDTLSHAVWAVNPSQSQSDDAGGLNFASDKSASDNAGNTALAHVLISNAKSYSYCYGIANPGSFVAAAEALDVTGADTVNAYAKVYNKKMAGPDVYVSTKIIDGDLHGYNNMAIASADLGYAFQSFDSATTSETGIIQCDSIASSLPSKWSNYLERITDPDASISTKVLGTVTDYEDAVVKSSQGTSIEQSGLISGLFTSKSNAGTASITRKSNYGTKFGLDMQANIASDSPSVKGTMTYYVDPSLKIQGAIAASQAGDLIGLAAGTYNENVNIQKAITLRGDNVQVNSVNNNGGKVYLNSKKVLIRADDLSWDIDNSAGWNWFTDLAKTDDLSVTYAVIPKTIDDKVAQFIQSSDKTKFEMATHGLYHERFEGLSYDAQNALIGQATQILTNFGYRPRTFVVPFSSSDATTVQVCKDLGYHTISSNYAGFPTVVGITQNAFDISLETDWSNSNYVSHLGATSFETKFANLLSSNTKTITLVLHPDTYSAFTANGQRTGSVQTQGVKDFVDSINWVKNQNVEFMTMEQDYQWENNGFLK